MIKQDREMIQAYSALRVEKDFIKAPLSHVPVPNDKDYEYGEIQRYFTQVTNQINGDIIEISREVWKDLQDNPLYRTIELRWKISGPLTDSYDEVGRRVRTGIRTSNRISVEQASKEMPALKNRLTNPLQLWRGF